MLFVMQWLYWQSMLLSTSSEVLWLSQRPITGVPRVEVLIRWWVEILPICVELVSTVCYAVLSHNLTCTVWYIRDVTSEVWSISDHIHKLAVAMYHWCVLLQLLNHFLITSTNVVSWWCDVIFVDLLLIDLIGLFVWWYGNGVLWSTHNHISVLHGFSN